MIQHPVTKCKIFGLFNIDCYYSLLLPMWEYEEKSIVQDEENEIKEFLSNNSSPLKRFLTNSSNDSVEISDENLNSFEYKNQNQEMKMIILNFPNTQTQSPYGIDIDSDSICTTVKEIQDSSRNKTQKPLNDIDYEEIFSYQSRQLKNKLADDFKRPQYTNLDLNVNEKIVL